jgi:hypothetical protein
MSASVPAANSSASKHASLSGPGCLKLVRERQLNLKSAPNTPGIATPMRVSGPLHGVRFDVPGPKSKYGVLDCRMGLALAAFAEYLRDFGVAAVRIDNFYRPGARLPHKRNRASQHASGLAADVLALTMADGSVLDVESDWGSGPDSLPCTPDQRIPRATEGTPKLRRIACGLLESGLFHHILTPSHDAAHRNHLHVDIKAGERTATID